MRQDSSYYNNWIPRNWGEKGVKFKIYIYIYIYIYMYLDQSLMVVRIMYCYIHIQLHCNHKCTLAHMLMQKHLCICNANTLTTLLVSRARALQNKCGNLCYSIIAPTLLARVNERLRCQRLKQKSFLLLTQIAQQFLPLPSPHWFIEADTHVPSSHWIYPHW